MTKKLTITVEENIIALAKTYAEKNGLSLSEIIQEYLTFLTTKIELKDSELTPKVKKLLGSVKFTGRDYKSSLSKAITQKYR